MSVERVDILSFLNALRAARIHYRLGHVRAEAILVEIAVPGERWEVEFVDDGSIEIEVFRSNGVIHDASILNDLMSKYSD